MSKATFELQDQNGLTGLWWFSELPVVGPYLMTYAGTDLAAPLKGKTRCSGSGKCSVCIRLARGAGIHLLPYVDSHNYLAIDQSNPKNCVMFFFKKTACVDTLGSRAGGEQAVLGDRDGTAQGMVGL